MMMEPNANSPEETLAEDDAESPRPAMKQQTALLICLGLTQLAGWVYGQWDVPFVPAVVLAFTATIYSLTYYPHPTKRLGKHVPVLIALFIGIGIPAYHAWADGWRGLWRGLGLLLLLLIFILGGVMLAYFTDGVLWQELKQEWMFEASNQALSN